MFRRESVMTGFSRKPTLLLKGLSGEKFVTHNPPPGTQNFDFVLCGNLWGGPSEEIYLHPYYVSAGPHKEVHGHSPPRKN